ncbi:MAG: hypothetical protein HYV35_11225 [Lentisphaerae bacterium]|nr:hypothetical protein [Lentisphaerota bacterium]
MKLMKVPANYYQQFDADWRLSVPGEGYGGWKKAEIELDLDHTAVVVMHAWDCGTREEFPGWYRAVDYIPRAQEIARTVFPKLLGAVRSHGLKLFHVVGGGNYYQKYPGYAKAQKLAAPALPAPWIESDPILAKLQQFRADHVFVGKHNTADVDKGFQKINFDSHAFPEGEEPVAENAQQLVGVCKETKVNHLIYAGFAIDWCLLMSPGGMLDMKRHGVMCSAFRQAVTAVENRETARRELCKEIGLWRVSLAFGFVFDVDEFISRLP